MITFSTQIIFPPWGLMVKEMTLPMHVRNLSDTKEPRDATSLLWVIAMQAVKEEKMQMNKESNLKELTKTIRDWKCRWHHWEQNLIGITNNTSEVTDSECRNEEVREFHITERLKIILWVQTSPGIVMRTKFFTGVTFFLFTTVFEFVALQVHVVGKLTLMDEFLMVLMKLRLSLLNEDISYRFGISVSGVKNISQVVGSHVH